jgi:hypothetical protein
VSPVVKIEIIFLLFYHRGKKENRPAKAGLFYGLKKRKVDGPFGPAGS